MAGRFFDEQQRYRAFAKDLHEKIQEAENIVILHGGTISNGERGQVTVRSRVISYALFVLRDQGRVAYKGIATDEYTNISKLSNEWKSDAEAARDQAVEDLLAMLRSVIIV